MNRRLSVRISFLAALSLVAASSTHTMAQSPSADDIIGALKPNASQLKGPTRGIRPVNVVGSPGAQDEGTDSGTPAATAARPGRPATRPAATEEPSVKLVVDFRTGSAELSPSATETLDQLGKALNSSALANFRFRVEGHTDTVGTPDRNKTLSEKRAEAVAEFLEHNFNISPNRLEPVGLGSSNLLVPTPDQTPEPRNRRVRIVNLGT
jgi:outer membrane protein OmpA-like peptidoglycan-associated protein